MSKLIFAGIVLAVGFTAFLALERRWNLLPGALGLVVPRLILVLTLAIPALVLTFSVLRVIPAGHVGVKILFGEVDPVPRSTTWW